MQITTELESLRSQITERLASKHNYSREYDFARLFAKLTDRPESSILSNIRDLAEHHAKQMIGRDKYARSLSVACDSIWEWFRQGENGEWNTSHMISFVESHCKQAVWAVLVGEEYRRVNHPELDDPMNEA